MKNAFRYIVAVSALLLSVVAFGQTKDEYKNAIKTKKTVEFNEETGVLERLVLETFVTGDGLNETTIIQEAKPMDAILVLDVSGSMSSSCGSKVEWVRLGNASDQTVLETAFNNYQKSSYNSENGTLVNLDRSWSGGWGGHWTYSAKIGNNNYTGPLYGKKETTISRMDALKAACGTFADIIAKNAKDNDIVNTISVVKFASNKSELVGNHTYDSGTNYSQIVVDRFSVSKTVNAQSVKNEINSFVAGGATQSDYGMQYANNILTNLVAATDRESTKVVVMFTDGDPSGVGKSGRWTESVANDAISAAKAMKASGAKVYVVATLDSEPSSTSNNYRYLQAVSSNYPDATGYTTATMGTAASDSYYKYASDAASLNNIFETISKESTEDVSKADVAITTSQVTVTDIIAPEFQIPAGADKITFFSAPATLITGTHGSRTENNYTWGAETAEASAYLVDASGNPLGGTPEKDKNGKTSVSVKGFDFNDNWVGTIVTREPGKDDVTEYHGRKLIIKIEIEPDPDFEGGFVTTNAEGSGVYVDGTNYQGITSVYEVDPIKVLSPKANLVIKKSGLNPGETILYTVTRKDDPSYKITVPLTADASGNATASVKADALKTKTTLWSYIVTEDNSWAWEYKSASESQEHALYKKVAPDPKTDKTEDLMCNVFDFGNAVLSDDGNALKPLDDAKTQTRYHEAAADNNFREVSEIN